MDVSSPRAVAPFVIRQAHTTDIQAINWLDTFSSSPHRDISRQVDRYFGSVDPSIHEQNLIFLAELRPDVVTDLPYRTIGKAELLLAPVTTTSAVGYIKRVVVQPTWRGHGIARVILDEIALYAREYGLAALDLHVGEDNTSAIHLYESLGFAVLHRELYLRQDLTASVAPVDDTPQASERIISRDDHAD